MCAYCGYTKEQRVNQSAKAWPTKRESRGKRNGQVSCLKRRTEMWSRSTQLRENGWRCLMTILAEMILLELIAGPGSNGTPAVKCGRMPPIYELAFVILSHDLNALCFLWRASLCFKCSINNIEVSWVYPLVIIVALCHKLLISSKIKKSSYVFNLH